MGNQASHFLPPAGAQMEDSQWNGRNCCPTVTSSNAVAVGTATLLAPAAIPVGLAYWYGKKLATDPNPACDPLCLRPKLERMSRSIDSLKDLYDRGMLMSYMKDSIACLGRPGLSEQQVRERPELRSEELCKMPILYKTKTVGSKVYIAKEDIPAFLQDNGIPMMNAEEVGDHLKSKLAAYFPISEFSCVGKYNIHGKVVVGSLGSPNNMAGLKPGEARYKIKINEDFSKYTADPLAYETKLKECILQALGLDHTKIPGAKKQIKVEYAKEGCVEIGLSVCLGVLAAAALVVFIAYYRNRGGEPNQMQALHACIQESPSGPQIPESQDGGSVFSSQSPMSPSNSTRRLLRHVEFRNLGHDDNDGWELVGYLHESTRCYLPETLFRTPRGGVMTARQLREGDQVAGVDRILEVVCKEVLQSRRRSLQTLRTAQAEITVTSSHRVVVFENDLRSERRAGDLRDGDILLCGTRRQRLMRVIPLERNTEVIELGFFPEPVETFQAPHFGVATLGHSSPAKRLMLRWRSFLNRLQWLRVAANHCFMICLRAVRHRHSCQ